MKPSTSAPGISSPLSRAVSLGESSSADPVWGSQPVPSYGLPREAQTRPVIQPPPVPQAHVQTLIQPEPARTTLPGIRDFMRNVQDQLTSDTWRQQH